MKENTALGTPLEILPKRARAAYVISRRAKPLSRRRVLRRCVLCMIYGELFWWSTRLWQLFLLKSWAVLLIVVVRIGDEILPRFQTPCLLNYQTEKFQKAICSRKIKTSCRIQSCKSTPQPLTGVHAGRGRPRRGAYRFEPEIVKKAEMQGAVPGCSCCRAFPMITTMSIKDSATMTGRLHLSLFVFLLQFIFGSFWRKECLNTPRPVHHELAVTVWHRATPILSPQLSGGGGGWLWGGGPSSVG